MPFSYTPLTPEGSSMRASILEFDGVRILADPGWDNISDITYLNSVINSVDLILLSHPTISFTGAYAYLAFQDLPIPTYATLPVINLSRVATIDLYRSAGIIGPLKGTQYELSDVEEAFDKIIPVKHSQTTDLRAKFDGLSITAINAGHTLGGTIWVLNKNSEKIIYAPEWNHSKDSFLNGADILQNSNLSRPSVFITSSALGSSLPHKKRVEKFFELVDATLGRGGTVLLPTSIGGRMLELIHLIDDHLQSAPIPVLLLSHAKARSLTYAGSMLEWMAPAVIKEWEARGQAPFDASRVEVIEPQELVNRPGAKVVFTAGAGFEKNSISQTALMHLCSDEKTTIILTERTPKGTIGHDFFNTWKSFSSKQEDGVPIPLQAQVNFSVIREESLIADELAEYEKTVKERRAAKELQRKQKTGAKKGKEKLQFDDDSDSDDDSDEDEEDILNPSATNRKKIEEKIPIDLDVRDLKSRAKMFPYIPNRTKTDDYGIIINPSDYSREEEKDVGKLKKRELRNVKIGEKKKWNEGKRQDDVSDLDALFQPRVRFTSEVTINARCVLSYVDLAGLVDLRSLSLIVPALKPKNVFLTSDLTDETNLAKVATTLKKHSKFEIFVFKDNETIVADNTVQSFDILLDENLSSQLKWQKIAGGFTIAHVIGEVKTKRELAEEVKKEAVKEEVTKGETVKLESIKEEVKEEIKKEDIKLKEDGEADVEMKDLDNNGDDLVLVPLQQNSAYLSNIRAAPLAIGDIRLSELKKILGDMDHRVEFKGEGTLVIDDIVAVRKVSDGDIVVDGAPGELFYKVRQAVRNMLAYV